jgi:hypothetical protein
MVLCCSNHIYRILRLGLLVQAKPTLPPAPSQPCKFLRLWNLKVAIWKPLSIRTFSITSVRLKRPLIDRAQQTSARKISFRVARKQLSGIFSRWMCTGMMRLLLRYESVVDKKCTSTSVLHLTFLSVCIKCSRLAAFCVQFAASILLLSPSFLLSFVHLLFICIYLYMLMLSLFLLPMC